MPKELTIYTLDFDESSTNLRKLKALANKKYPASEGWKRESLVGYSEETVWARYRPDKKTGTGIAYATIEKQTFNLID